VCEAWFSPSALFFLADFDRLFGAMKKFKVKTNSKGKRWAKGHSCVSNPDATKYRDSAKSRFFQPNLGLHSAIYCCFVLIIDFILSWGGKIALNLCFARKFAG